MTKKILKGTVISSKSNKTIVVEVTRKFKHPFYEKVIKRTKKYHAHDDKNKFKESPTSVVTVYSFTPGTRAEDPTRRDRAGRRPGGGGCDGRFERRFAARHGPGAAQRRKSGRRAPAANSWSAILP